MENNKLTPKQRAKIYKEVAILQSKVYYDVYFCNYVNNKYKLFCDDFPEYNLFEPSFKENKFEGSAWFTESCIYANNYNNASIKKEGLNQKVLALLFAYQMALDAKE